VVKFRSAGQGRKALVAEVIAGELARALGLPVPALVGVELDPVIGAAEPDQEIQELLKGSEGLTSDGLPARLPGIRPVGVPRGSRARQPGAVVRRADPERRPVVAEREPAAVAPQALPDRPRRVADLPSQLAGRAEGRARAVRGRRHVLASYAKDMPGADAELAPRVTEELLRSVVAMVPDEWLADEPGFTSPTGCATRMSATC